MSALSEIKEPIAQEMKEFDVYFKNTLKTKTSLLNIVTNYIIRTKGKQLRPILVFLSAGMHGKINDSTFRAAALIELMHTATLTHDDVVDDSDYRRGILSINAIWKNKIAVLIGDYLLAQGLLLSVRNKEFDLLEIVSHATSEMSQGELLQIEKARKLNIDEESYFKIIEQKTAVLIAACVKSGTRSVSHDSLLISKMEEFGMALGMAFQIKDDLFDYTKNNSTGKPSGNDIKEKKVTLPLIHTLKNCSKKEFRHINSLLKKRKKSNHDIAEVINLVIKNGGVEHATAKMLEYKDKALDILHQFPDNEYSLSLEKVINFTVSRKK